MSKIYEVGEPLKTYKVTWTIEIDSIDEIQAAKLALSYIADKDSQAHVFDVQEKTESFTIDLDNL